MAATTVWIGLGFFILFGFGLDPLGVRASILRCELLLFWVALVDSLSIENWVSDWTNVYF